MADVELNLQEIIGTAVATKRIVIYETICNGCGLCGEVCPFGLPQPNDSGKYFISAPELCTECSACKRNCPTQAIMLNEQQGCGCLWDARGRAKNEKKGLSGSSGCGCAPTATNCCESSPSSQTIKVGLYNGPLTPVKPSLDINCCNTSETELKTQKNNK